MRNWHIKEVDILVPHPQQQHFREVGNIRLRVSGLQLGMKKLKQEKSSEVFVDNYSKKVQLRTKLNTIYGLCRRKHVYFVKT